MPWLPEGWSQGAELLSKYGAAIVVASMGTAFVWDFFFWRALDPRILAYYVLADHVQTAVQIVALILLGTSFYVLPSVLGYHLSSSRAVVACRVAYASPPAVEARRPGASAPRSELCGFWGGWHNEAKPLRQTQPSPTWNRVMKMASCPDEHLKRPARPIYRDRRLLVFVLIGGNLHAAIVDPHN